MSWASTVSSAVKEKYAANKNKPTKMLDSGYYGKLYVTKYHSTNPSVFEYDIGLAGDYKLFTKPSAERFDLEEVAAGKHGRANWLLAGLMVTLMNEPEYLAKCIKSGRFDDIYETAKSGRKKYRKEYNILRGKPEDYTGE